MRFGNFLWAAFLLTPAGLIHAQDEGARIGWVFEADLEYGGDNVATVSFTDGSSQNLKAGQGLTLALGGHFRPNDSSPYSMRATAGYKFATTAASNADIGIDRLVFEVVANHLWDSGFRIGMGVTHHTGIQFDGDGFGPDLDFRDATGFTAELGWKWIALSYTKLDYTDEFGGTWDAGSVGLTLTNKF